MGDAGTLTDWSQWGSPKKARKFRTNGSQGAITISA